MLSIFYSLTKLITNFASLKLAFFIKISIQSRQKYIGEILCTSAILSNGWASVALSVDNQSKLSRTTFLLLLNAWWNNISNAFCKQLWFIQIPSPLARRTLRQFLNEQRRFIIYSVPRWRKILSRSFSFQQKINHLAIVVHLCLVNYK